MSGIGAFASPAAGDFPGLASRLSRRMFDMTVAGVNALAARIGEGGLTGLEPTSRASAINEIELLRPELGAIWLGLGSAKPEDLSWLVGQAYLAAYFSRVISSLDYRVTGLHPLVAAGHLVRGENLTLCADEERLQIFADKRPVLCLTRVIDGAQGWTWPVWVVDAATDIVQMGSGVAAVISSAEWLSHWMPEQVQPTATADDVSRRKVVIDTAMQLLERHTPGYYLWVSLLLREYVPLAPGGSTSQTFVCWPGQVHAAELDVAQTVSILVHETAHLYFHLLARWRAFVKADAPCAYSVVTRKQRPLERVLLAYHACANSLLALTQLRAGAANIHPSELDAELAKLHADSAELCRELDRHREFLSPLGESLLSHLEREVGKVCDRAGPLG